MKNLGEVQWFLGLEVEKTSQGYFICQRRYAKSLLKHFNMKETKEMPTSMKINLKVKKDKGKLLKDATSFRQLLGSLIYLTITRPEMAQFIGVVSQFMHDPRTPHEEAAKRILRYIKGSVDYGLMYEKRNDFILKWVYRRRLGRGSR